MVRTNEKLCNEIENMPKNVTKKKPHAKCYLAVIPRNGFKTNFAVIIQSIYVHRKKKVAKYVTTSIGVLVVAFYCVLGVTNPQTTL